MYLMKSNNFFINLLLMNASMEALERGGGKSVALLMEAFQRSIETPGHKALLLRRSYKQLQTTLLRYMREFFPKDFGRFVKTDMVYHFPNSSLIDFGYLDSEDDKYEYQGREYDFVGFEELTQFTESKYLYLFSSIRSSKENTFPVIRATSNPGNIGHNWVKERFIDAAEPMEIWEVDLSEEMGDLKIDGVDLSNLSFTRQFIPATVFDNKYIMKNDPMYIARLHQLPEDEKKAYLYGDWNVFSGQVFKEFNRKTHVLSPFKIPRHWAKYMAIDPGYAEPFAIVWGAVASEEYNIGDRTIPEGSIVIYREWYGCKEHEPNKGIEIDVRQIAWGIIEREDEPVNIRIAGQDMWNRTGHDGPTRNEIFAEEGLYLNRPDTHRINGKMQVHDRLRIDEETGEPSLYFLDNCPDLIRTLPALPYNPKKPEDVETRGVEDHLYDALRYLLMARPMKVRVKKNKKKKRKTNKYTGY